MIIIQEILRIIFAIGLFLLPAVLLAGLLRLPPLNRFAQRKPSTRTGIVLVTALLCFGIYYGALAWLVAQAIYSIARFYFDSTFGLVSGVTLAQVEQFHWGIIRELWFRALLPIAGGQRCFSETAAICQLANIASKIGSPQSYSLIAFAMALFSALITLLLGFRFTRPPVDRRKLATESQSQ